MHLLFLGVTPQDLCAALDPSIAHWFRAHLTPLLAQVWQVMSAPGSEVCITALLLVAVAILVWRRAWHALVTLMLAVPGGALLGQLLKHVIQRPRPFLAGPFGEWGGYSFPSGHTIAATLLYGTVALVLLPLLARTRHRFLVLAAGVGIIATVGFSRIALGAHYLSDVLGAMAIGSCWIACCWLMATPLRRRAALALAPIPVPQSTGHAGP